MPGDLCPCGSLAPFESCHGVLEADYYSAPKGESLLYRPPPSWRQQMAREMARRYSSMGLYDVRVRDDGQWEFRLSEPVRFVRHYPLVRAAEDDKLAFFRKPLENCNTWGELQETISLERRRQAFERLQNNEPFRQPEDLDRFQQDMLAVLACPSAQDLADSVHAAGSFLLDRFPQGSIDLVWKDKACLSYASLLRMLAQQELLSLDEIKDGLFAGRGPFGTWYLTLDPGPYFSVLRHIGYPSVTGFELFGAEFGFLVDYGADVDFPSLEALDRCLRGTQTWLFAEREEPSMRKITTGLGSRHKLRVWLSRCLNNLSAQLGYLGAFADPVTNTVRPVQQWKDLLTLRDIASITQLLLTTSEPALAKLLFFDLVDRYRGLGNRSVTDLMSATFLTKKVASAIDPGLAEFREPVQRLTREGWSRVVERLWDGIYSKTIRAGNHITLSDGKTLDKDAFASKALQALRNTLHGYNLQRTGEFETVLSHHHGALPAAVRDLALGLWFGLLSSPALFWGSRARLHLMSPHSAATATTPTP